MQQKKICALVLLMSLVMISITACSKAPIDSNIQSGKTADSSGENGTITIDEEAAIYSAEDDNTHAIEADGESVSYDNIIVKKTGNGEGENADFYGENAAVFATNGAKLDITNADITTDGQYANAVFSYGENTIINISDSSINTSERNSGGIMVTGGGTLNAKNLTIETQGGSSAAIRSDRGGGIMNVEGGSYTANGSGSPAIYSTADVTVSKAKLQSGSAQAVVVEGGNKVTLNDCEVVGNNTVQNSDNSDYFQAVMLYQSMSGDASGGDGSFTMTDGSLTSLNGGMFFVTNATYAINLKDVDMTYADDELLRVCKAGWGNEGKNGGQVTFKAEKQTLEGNIIVDSISKVNMYLDDDSTFKGSINNEGSVYVEISGGSKWVLTDDCSITSLTCDADSIELNGHKLTVGGKEYAEGSKSTGEAIEFTISEGPDMKDGNPPEKPDGDGKNPPEKPNGDGQNPPEKPDGQNPPERPDGQNPPERPDGQTPPERPDGQNPPMGPGGDGQNPPEKPNGDRPTPPDWTDDNE